MSTKIKPIKPILKEIKKLSKDPNSNKKELERLRKIVLDQVKVINSIDFKRLDYLINSNSIDKDKKEKYMELEVEYFAYRKNDKLIKQITDRDYKGIKQDRELKMKKLAVGLSATAVAAILAACLIFKPKKNDNVIENTTQVTTEATTETTETEVTTEKETTTEKMIKKPTETTTEKVTEATEKTAETTTEKTTEATTQEKETTTEKVTESNTETTVTTRTVTLDEQKMVVDLFGMMKDEIVELKDSNEAKTVKEKGREYFINTVDFIFFGSSVNGVTFSDLKDEFKEEVFDSLKAVDKAIMHFDPDYKEQLGDKYNAVKDFSKEKLGKAKELIIKKIGQEKYDSIIEKKEEIIDKITDSFKKYGGKALDYIKKKYLDWRDK